uniref:RING-type E3 ubiquitin transferase n=1 Tax=Rhizophora mucronata TaxID=61149 RepID=A0A2P2PKJ5_RHIMU
MDSQGEQGDSKKVNWGKGYALSGRIMMSVFVILFFVVILMLGLHLYARWYLLRVRRRQRARARSRPRRTHLVFYVDPSNPNAAHVTLPSRGLDADVLKSLPVFVYSSDTHPDPIECAVCLSELEEKEIGRTLPKCNHSFHIQCIDMWLHSHSTCPLCRSPVEYVPENPAHVVPSTDTTETSACSDLCDTCRHEAEHMGPSTSSFRGRSKPAELVGVTIDVPGTNFDSESRTESPSTQSLRSPIYRVLSFTRILSRERRGSVSPSSSSAATCVGGPAAAESDIERGKEETQETR